MGKIFAIFFAPYMVIDSCQKRFILNLQLRQCFARAKPFTLKKNKKPDFYWYFLFNHKKPSASKKA